jgi:hypothetical protein
MSVFGFLGIVLLSLIITGILVIIYIKALSVVGDKLKAKFRKNKCNTGSNSSSESDIVVGCIYCFDKSYNFMYTHIITSIQWIIKYIIGIKKISKPSNNSNRYCRYKSDKTDCKSLSVNSHPDKSSTVDKHDSTKSYKNLS